MSIKVKDFPTKLVDEFNMTASDLETGQFALSGDEQVVLKLSNQSFNPISSNFSLIVNIENGIGNYLPDTKFKLLTHKEVSIILDKHGRAGYN